MKKLILFSLLAGVSLIAGEFQIKNANFDITFDTKGATVKKLIHNKVDWNAAGPKSQGNSFCDSRLGKTVAPKTQFHEDFGSLQYTIEKWTNHRGAGNADITFTAKGRAYNWLRIRKTYKVRPGNLLEVVYEFINTSKKAEPLSFSTRYFFHRTDRENLITA